MIWHFDNLGDCSSVIHGIKLYSYVVAQQYHCELSTKYACAIESSDYMHTIWKRTFKNNNKTIKFQKHIFT